MILLGRMLQLTEFIRVVLPPVLTNSFISCGGLLTFPLTYKLEMGAVRASRVSLTIRSAR